MNELKNKTLVMIVGPAAIGKSTLMNEVVRQNPANYGYVKSFTTRSRRPGETAHYDFISREHALSLHQSGQTITYLDHPTTHDLYGTTASSYTAPINLLDTLSGSVKDYRNLPFAETVTISLTTPASQWKEWFLQRYPRPSDEAIKRLTEAKQSISWSLNDSETLWLINDGPIKAIAAHCIDVISDKQRGDEGIAYAKKMLNSIDTMWS